MTQTLTLYHASVAGITGALYALGDEQLFCPCQDTRVYVLAPNAPVIIVGPIATEVVPLVIAQIEARLHQSLPQHLAKEERLDIE